MEIPVHTGHEHGKASALDVTAVEVHIRVAAGDFPSAPAAFAEVEIPVRDDTSECPQGPVIGPAFAREKPTGRGVEPAEVHVLAAVALNPGVQQFALNAQRVVNPGRFKTAGRELTVVGWLDGGDGAFDSEIWMDVDEARAVFDRENYSSTPARMTDEAAAAAFIQRIESDKRAPFRPESEVKYYSDQTQTALSSKILGNFLATAMSIGATFAAMNTMYASVGARTREIGTLRVPG
jgi:hypothetical protein